MRYCRKQKELLKNAKSYSRAFRGPKAGKSAYFMPPDFSAVKLKKQCANFASKYGNSEINRFNKKGQTHAFHVTRVRSAPFTGRSIIVHHSTDNS
jgi:hypothetical protein